MKVTASTLLINVVTSEYPVSLLKVRQDNPNISFAAEPEDSVLDDLGYSVVHRVDAPAGDVVTEGAPEYVDGAWRQTWVVREFTAEELAAQLQARKSDMTQQIDQLRDATLANGFRFVFSGEAGEQGVQVREQDKINIVASRIIADAFINMGQPETLMDFRTFENNTLRIPATEIVALSNAAFQRVTQVYAAAWVLKDQVAAATTLAELPVLPETLDV